MLPNSLRACLLLLVALAILPMAAMTIWSTARERQHAETTARDNLQRLANLAAANAAQSLGHARQILHELSTLPDVISSTARCDQLMADILRKNPGFVNFGRVQRDGRISCSAVGGTSGINLSDRLHFRRAVSERRFIAGNYIFGRVIQKHTINLTLPVISGGRVIGVVFAAVDLEMLNRFASEIQLPPDSVVWTVDETGTTIAREPAASGWLGERVDPELQRLFRAGMPAAGRLLNRDGVERMYAFAPVGNAALSRYTVAIGVPYAQIAGPAGKAQQVALLSLAVAVGLALLAAWLGGEWLVVRHIRRLGATARSIASGNLAARTGIQTRQEEIGDLADALDGLAAELQARDIERNATNHKLREADHSQDKFLAMLAHELRRLLIPLSSGVQLLKRAHDDDPEASRSVKLVERQARQMAQLLERLLDVSRLTRGLLAVELVELPLRSVLEEAFAQAAPLFAGKRQQAALAPGDDIVVLGDRKRLVQAIAELLDNAARHTPEGGHVAVSLAVVQGRALLAVADDGAGMSASLLSHAFEPFAQGECVANGTQAGLGIGLALARMLVELHDGTIRAESEGPGHGSTFTIELDSPIRPRTP